MFKFLKSFFRIENNNDIYCGDKKIRKNIIFDSIALKVLNKEQLELKSLLEDFSTTHFLWWWTAISLYLWHRESIDFDFFNNKTQWSFKDYLFRIKNNWFSINREEIMNYSWIENEDQDEFHFYINWVNFTTFNFFRTLYNDQKILIKWNNYILWWLRIASMQELISMKLYAMMTRNKWKDAVDLFFLLKELKISLKEALNISKKEYFINILNIPNILEQLISNKWNKKEKVNYLIKNPPKDKEIVDFLKREALKNI